MFVVSDSARDGLNRILQSQSAVGKSMVLYLEGAG